MSERHHLDLPLDEVPLALAERHRELPVGARLATSHDGAGDDELLDVVVGAGFDGVRLSGSGPRFVDAVRARTLPDTVGPGMRLLVCGLNPSLHAADAGVGFVTPSNRFWPAAIEAGLVSRPRDAFHALRAHGIGMTDLAKRATRRADELSAAEYAAGVERVDRLCRRLQPGAVVCVGLAGWRAAVDRRAGVGVQDRTLGGRPVYVMPSTSGLNARTSRTQLVAHLRAALALAEGGTQGLPVSL